MPGGTSFETTKPLVVQMAQTRTAPSSAPRLLALPPTISMVQIWKVRMGWKSNGLT